MKVKDALVELARQLPDECTWEEAMYRLYVRQRIEAGIKDAEEGQLVDDDEVFKDFER